MTDERNFPVIALGAAGALAVATLLRPKKASADAPRPPAPTRSAAQTSTPSIVVTPTPRAATPLFDFARPLPARVHAVVSSGWLESRGARLHRGLDIAAPTGTPILAIDQGVVTQAVRVDRSVAGLWVAVKHPSGVTSRYLHLSRVLVQRGQLIRRGQTVGLCGATGNARNPHLHLDLRVPAEMLPTIERTIGKPRPGWGSEMQPFGVSIPGEPWVPVDAYSASVRRDAEEAGVPLRAQRAVRNGGLSYRPVGKRGEPYPVAAHGPRRIGCVRDPRA